MQTFLGMENPIPETLHALPPAPKTVLSLPPLLYGQNIQEGLGDEPRTLLETSLRKAFAESRIRRTIEFELTEGGDRIVFERPSDL